MQNSRRGLEAPSEAPLELVQLIQFHLQKFRWTIPEEDRTMLQLQRIALKAHQEARQAMDLRKDLARRVMLSDGPYSPGEVIKCLFG